MHFLIENNIDFFNALNSEEELNDCSKCLITNTPLEDNFITLNCNHSFNYDPLFEEIRNQKKINGLETRKVSHSQTKCPYCRTITNNILPYFSKYGHPLIYGVNSPERYSIKMNECDYKFKTGKMKGLNCSKSACKSQFGIFCNSHYKMMENKAIKEVKKIKKLSTTKTQKISKSLNISNSPIIDLPEVGLEIIENKVIETFYNVKEDVYKNKHVNELKNILRVNGCKVSGRKQELIDRILMYKIKNDNHWIKHE